MDENTKAHLQAGRKVEAARFADLLDMDDSILLVISDYYEKGQLNEETTIAYEALVAMAEE